MTLRLKSYDFYIRLWHYLLPLLAFAVAAYVRLVAMNTELPRADYEPRFYFAVLLCATVLWAAAVEHWRLCSIEGLFREYTGMQKSIAAWFATYAALLAILFFYRQYNFSRAFFILSAVALLTLTIGTRIAMRRLFHMTRHMRRSVRVMVAGTDHHARRIAERLAEVPFMASEVVGYLRIGDQQVTVHDAPVYGSGGHRKWADGSVRRAGHCGGTGTVFIPGRVSVEVRTAMRSHARCSRSWGVTAGHGSAYFSSASYSCSTWTLRRWSHRHISSSSACSTYPSQSS